MIISSSANAVKAKTEIVCIYGKAWDFQVKEILKTTLQENLIGIRVVKTYVREDYEIDKFEEKTELIKRFSHRAEKILAFNGPLMQVCMYTSMILVFSK